MHPFMSPSTINVANVSDELRDKALQHTATMLRKIDEVRRQLELPVEQLPVVIETYGKVVLALIAEEERKKLAERTSRLPMTMRSENRDREPMKILPTQKVDVIVRPQTVFRAENLAIHGDPSRWVVHDIKVGNQSQFAAKHGPARGTEFGVGGILLEQMKLETCQTAMDFVIVVEYVGPVPEGEIFEATIVGKAINF